jgi:chaperonin cofactor prefoldin
MLNWRRDPAREMRLNQLESEIEQLKQGRVQIEKELALLDWMHSELDLIEADLPSSSTPPPTTAANSSDC